MKVLACNNLYRIINYLCSKYIHTILYGDGNNNDRDGHSDDDDNDGWDFCVCVCVLKSR